MRRWLLTVALLALPLRAEAGLISYSKTWVNGEVLTHSDLNGNFTNVTDQVNGSLDATNLAATITFSDGDFLDLSSINLSGASEGIKMPQATSLASMTGEGQCGWDTDDDIFRCGNGSTLGDWNMPDAAIMDGTPQLIFRDTTDDTAWMFHADTTNPVTGFTLWRGTKTSATGAFSQSTTFPLMRFNPTTDTLSLEAGGLTVGTAGSASFSASAAGAIRATGGPVIADVTQRTAGSVSLTNSLSDITGLTITMTTLGPNPVLLGFQGSANDSDAGETHAEFLFDIDGSSVNGTVGHRCGLIGGTPGTTMNCSFTAISTDLAPGSHTFKLRGRTDTAGGGTLVCTTSTPCQLWVMEVMD